ncbi:MAG: phage minor head protein [Dehalococcoidia bacterium]|jgi:SPP1 gp7 family putative phage head morphogenesis protein
MTLPDRQIHAILQKFGPQIVAYLRSVGYFDQEGPYEPLDLINAAAMKKYLAASKAKNTEIWHFLEGIFTTEIALNSSLFAKAYRLEPVWNVEDIAKIYFKKHAGEFITRTTATDKKRLIAYVWANAGKNERPLARQILREPNLASIVDYSGARAKTIVRTERHRATWGSSLEFAKGAGSETKQWATVGDGRVRSRHRAQNGVIVGMDEAFPDGERFPGETSINCRCRLLYGFDSSVRRTGIQAGTKTPPPYVGLSDTAISELYS